MAKLYVLPTREDQLAFEAGMKPRNCVVREFDGPEVARAYHIGLAAREANVIRESYLEMTLVFSRGATEDEEVFNFNSVAEKGAFRQGMEDGEGRTSLSIVHDEDSAQFQALEAMYASDGERVFVRCEEGSQGLLKSFGAKIGAYDLLRRGVVADVSGHVLSQIRQFPADFEIEFEAPAEAIDAANDHSESPGAARNAMLVFLRHESADVTTVAMLSLKTTLATDAEVMTALVDATTQWVQKTDAGRKLWNQSDADLNIGDLASSGAFADAILLNAFRQRGIEFVGCTVADTDEFALPYDSLLVDANKLEVVQAEMPFVGA